MKVLERVAIDLAMGNMATGLPEVFLGPGERFFQTYQNRGV